MDQKEALRKARKYKVLIQKHFDLDKLYLYGSYANQTNKADSDIDIAVVVNSLSGDYFSFTPLLWRLRRKVDSRIEPVIIEKGKDLSGFLEEIEKHGIEV